MVVKRLADVVMPEACRKLAGWWSEPCERNHRFFQMNDRAPAGALERQLVSAAPARAVFVLRGQIPVVPLRSTDRLISPVPAGQSTRELSWMPNW